MRISLKLFLEVVIDLFTDTAAILNKSDLRSIMGFAGGKTNLAWQARRTSFFLFCFYLRAFCSFICLDENKEELSIEELNAWNVEKLQKYLNKIGALLSPVILVNATWFRKFIMFVQFFSSYLALPVLVTFHYQGASNINCSTIVFICEVCCLSLPVSSATYDVTF